MQLSDRIFFVVASWPLKAANHKFDESNTWIKGLSSLKYGAADLEQCFANPVDHVLNIPGRSKDGDEAYICFRFLVVVAGTSRTFETRTVPGTAGSALNTHSGPSATLSHGTHQKRIFRISLEFKEL